MSAYEMETILGLCLVSGGIVGAVFGLAIMSRGKDDE